MKTILSAFALLLVASTALAQSSPNANTFNPFTREARPVKAQVPTKPTPAPVQAAPSRLIIYSVIPAQTVSTTVGTTTYPAVYKAVVRNDDGSVTYYVL